MLLALAEDAFSDAPIEDDVLNFLESQRLRVRYSYQKDKEKERKRQNYYERKSLVLPQHFTRLSSIIASIATLCCILRRNSQKPMQKRECLEYRDPFSINSLIEIFLRTFDANEMRYKIDNVENFFSHTRTFPDTHTHTTACF